VRVPTDDAPRQIRVPNKVKAREAERRARSMEFLKEVVAVMDYRILSQTLAHTPR